MKGRGHVELTGAYAATYAALAAIGEATATQLGQRLKVTPTAMSNRLHALARFGLAKSERDGRIRRWRIAKQTGGR